jgi:hypothetical protein
MLMLHLGVERRSAKMKNIAPEMLVIFCVLTASRVLAREESDQDKTNVDCRKIFEVPSQFGSAV